MSKTPFVHLNTHSFYSILDGLSPPEDYVKKAVEQGATALGMADKGTMHGAIDFYKACKKHNIKPIIGCEVNIAFNKLTDKRHQIDNKRTTATLIAKDNEGYENLLKMATVASLEGYYYKPRVDWDLMKKHSTGLIALSGGLSGDVAQAVLTGDDNRIDEVIEKFQSTFGKENFYLEIQHHPELPQQKQVNDKVIELSKEKKIPLVLTCNAHYVNPEDNIAQDIVVCIKGAKNLDDTRRFSMANADHSMKDPDRLAEAFKDVPEALENTVKIAERCQVEFDFDTYRIPTFPVPEGKTEVQYMRELCYQGLMEKYKIDPPKIQNLDSEPKSEDPDVQEKIDRLEYELKMITEMGFVGYFLIVWDFVKWAKDHGIIVGPGRGSAAGAIVSYCLDITEIDPLKYNLLFERFLNPARVSMPDIDLDFTDTRRDEVIDYVAQKYGRDRVAQICTFGTLAARAAVKDVGRTMGVGFGEMNEFAKLIPEKPGTKLKEALEQTKELSDAVEGSDTYSQIMESALKLEGAIRHVSVHACGVVIADEPLTKYTALQHPPKDDKGMITQYSAKPLESLGLLKMDFLGLKNLTILERALEIIERTQNKKINLKTISMEDKKTFALLSRGETTGVFQLESGGMKRYLKELRPNEFEDIIAMVSLYRPGPMEWIPDYIAGKHGRKQTTYLHPSLEPILRTTYGIAIYQEQILQIAQEFAGFSLGEADLLRRAIGKKIASELEAQREKFIQGSIDKGHSKDLAVTIFEKVIEPFAGYGFNKSHAACYAMIAYQTAYLKAHHPTEFMTALMSADYGNTDRIVIEISECEQMGVQVLPPDINESLTNFTVVEEGKIRFGLSAVKGLGQGSVKAIIEARKAEKKPFDNLQEFAKRVPSRLLNKKTIEALSYSGALDRFGDRKQIALSHEQISDFAKTASQSYQAGQVGLFDTMGDDAPKEELNLAEVEPATEEEKLKWEKDLLGLYISSHPLKGLNPFFKRKVIPLDQLEVKSTGKPIKVGGLVAGMRKIITKKGDPMAIVFLEDPFSKAECVLFPKTYAKLADTLVEDSILLVQGKLEERGGNRQVVVKEGEVLNLQQLQTRAKHEGLWNPDEKLERSTRQDVEEQEVEVAEQVMEVKEEQVSELSDDSLFVNKKARQILINKHVDKSFFSQLKVILGKYPGQEDLELVIGEKVLPLPMKVKWGEALEGEVNGLLDG